MPVAELLHSHWEAVLVMFSALVLIPKGLCILSLRQPPVYWLPAFGLCAAYLFFPAPWAPLFALPYLLLAIWTAVREGAGLLVLPSLPLKAVLRVFILAYWATGAIWAVCFLAGFRPFGFDPVIVGLTAAHFHVAGFVLGTVIYAQLEARNSIFNRLLGAAALLGMPLVATGILLTQKGYTPAVEGAASLLFAGMALAVAGGQLSRFFQNKWPRAARWYWLGGAVGLLGGATLAALYALRFQWPIPGIDIPTLKVWHGTLNTLAFGWLSLQGWKKSGQISKLYPSATN